MNADLGINALAHQVHTTAVNHGWWERERGFPEAIALMHSELSEALEAWRSNDSVLYTEDTKPEGSVTELADCIIRILDWCKHNDWPITEALMRKAEYNETRPYRHGGKRA